MTSELKGEGGSWKYEDIFNLVTNFRENSGKLPYHILGDLIFVLFDSLTIL